MKQLQDKIFDILQEELIPAFGCTEPIAIAFAAAKARQLLGRLPEEMCVLCSGNIIKNVKGVVVPTTGDMRGIEASAILGAVAGNPELGLEVLRDVKPEDVEQTRVLREKGLCKVDFLDGKSNLQIIVELFASGERALVEVAYAHTNIVRMEKNGQVLFRAEGNVPVEETDRSFLTLPIILDFAEQVSLEKIAPMMERQLEYNMNIAREGLGGNYGAAVGRTLLEEYGTEVKVQAKAYAAAGSDARMAGCEMPVIINSGSGNQGITTSVPVHIYAKHLNVDWERECRALVLSNLVAIYQKKQLGKLSAYCGAVSAAAGAGAAIAYLHGADRETISNTIINTLGNVSGIVCDGAKSSCAAKIASSVDAAILGYQMARHGRRFQDGEGLVALDAEQTIVNVGRMGSIGMRSTDTEILKIMTGV